MKNNTISPMSLLSTLWIFILFNMLLRDLHEFPTDGYIEELMTLKLSELEMLIYAFIVEIPISMVLLSRILSVRYNRWANIIAAIVSALGIISTLPGADLDDIFFAIVNIGALIVIIKTANKLVKFKTLLK